jgi:hypothetical protein
MFWIIKENSIKTALIELKIEKMSETLYHLYNISPESFVQEWLGVAIRYVYS